MTTSPDSREAEMLALIDEAVSQNPYTNYSFAAQNAAVERTRATKYARMIARVALRSSLPKQAGASREELLAVVDKIRGGTRDGWGYGRDECAEFIARVAAKPADDGVRELKLRIHNLRVTLSSVVTLAESAPINLKTQNAIGKAAKHSLDRDAALNPPSPGEGKP